VKARRPWALAFVPLYAAGLAAKDALRHAGMFPTRTLTWPVVSVGSLSAGGAGKTPVVIALAALLRDREYIVDVLSRGYGRSGHAFERVDASMDNAAARFGDEPLLITQRAGVPVWVSADRFAAGKAAEANGIGVARGVHLLDDGFQHRRLARAMDVVLVTAEDLDDALLPAGNRREPLRALRRADAIVVREQERDRVMPQLSRWMRSGAVIWTIHRRINVVGDENVFDNDVPLLAFCAIARPQGFVEMLRAQGGRVVDSVTFPDHYAYTATDLQRLIASCRASGASGFITTEKDAVKLSPKMRTQLEAGAPLHIAKLHTEFLDEAAVIRDLEACCS
jgi:tetraacyldisaccharide 4'-kinase